MLYHLLAGEWMQRFAADIQSATSETDRTLLPVCTGFPCLFSAVSAIRNAATHVASAIDFLANACAVQ